MNEPEPTIAAPATTVDSMLRRVRTIAVISALSAVVVGVLALMAVLLSFYPSLQTTVNNLERISEAMAVSAESFAGISDEAAQNLANASANLNEASMNFNQASENFEQNSLGDGIAETVIRLLEQGERGRNR